MKITIAAIGDFQNDHEKQLYSMYEKRNSWKLNLKTARQKKLSTNAMEADYESRLLLEMLVECDVKIALDSNGKQLSTEGLHSYINKCALSGNSHLGFAIGGPCGISADSLLQYDASISFGVITWPHSLVRVMLAEQLYRCYSIDINHPYHRAGKI